MLMCQHEMEYICCGLLARGTEAAVLEYRSLVNIAVYAFNYQPVNMARRSLFFCFSWFL